jgi:hypothetical protein
MKSHLLAVTFGFLLAFTGIFIHGLFFDSDITLSLPNANEKQQLVREVPYYEVKTENNNQPQKHKKELIYFKQPKLLETKAKNLNSEEENLNSTSSNKDTLIKMVQNLDESQLKLATKLLSGMNAKQPKELFDSESIDFIWSQQKQSELEYSFYENNAFNGIAELQDITCKSSFCRVEISLLDNVDYSIHQFTAWSSPVSMHLKSSKDGSQPQLLEIYIARR